MQIPMKIRKHCYLPKKYIYTLKNKNINKNSMREICLIICENTIKSFPRRKAGPEKVAQLMTMKVTTLTTRKEEFACEKNRMAIKM